MTIKFIPRKNLPIVLALFVLLLTIPVLLWGLTQRQELRNRAAEPENFPNVDLNNDGIVNSVDYKIYLDKFAKSPMPSP